MGIAEDWGDLMFHLDCLSKGQAKRKFRKSIKYGWGGLCAYCRCNRATTLTGTSPYLGGNSENLESRSPMRAPCNPPSIGIITQGAPEVDGAEIPAQKVVKTQKRHP